MKMYKVTITETAEYVYFVEAARADKARAKAETDFLTNITLGGACKTVDVIDREVVSEIAS